MLLPPSPLKKYLLHPLEAVFAVAVYGLFWLMPIRMASAIGGWLGRTIGPKIGLSRRANKNLKRAMPELSDAEISQIIVDMWNNLGRNAGEFPSLSRLDVYGPESHIEVVGAEYIDVLRDDGKPGIFVSGHFANWEIPAISIFQRGLTPDVVFREANNRLLGWLYVQGRSANEGAKIPKGAHGARQIVQCMRDNRHLGLLIDQKMNDGIAVPFFGIEAMTAPAVGEMARRYDCPVVPVQVQRLDGINLKVTFYPPMALQKTDNQKSDVLENMTRINAMFEKWIRENPAQWLWLHNRWPDEK